MKGFKMCLLILICFTFQFISAQQDVAEKEKYNKGCFFISWGGNRSYYTDSDIHFKGPGYNFILENVQAQDKPKGVHIDYVNPLRMTIPQTNLRIGYFITDNYSISLGVDHMKYVVTQYQDVAVNGSIAIQGSPYSGNYNNDVVSLTPDFLEFEHTDGLNYINVELTRMDNLGALLFNWDNPEVRLNVLAGIGAGVLYPKTNVRLLDNERNDTFHVAGYGASLKVGINGTFFRHLFVQAELKGGFINMDDIRTTKNRLDKASQQFGFLQTNISLGYIFKI